MKIRTHKHLETYQMAFSSAMEIFELSKKFSKNENFRLPIKSEDHPVQFAQIWPKLLGKGVIQSLSPQSCLTPKERQRKPRYGLISPWRVNMWMIRSIIQLFEDYERIIGKLVNMSLHPEKWRY